MRREWASLLRRAAGGWPVLLFHGTGDDGGSLRKRAGGGQGDHAADGGAEALELPVGPRRLNRRLTLAHPLVPKWRQPALRILACPRPAHWAGVSTWAQPDKHAEARPGGAVQGVAAVKPRPAPCCWRPNW